MSIAKSVFILGFVLIVCDFRFVSLVVAQTPPENNGSDVAETAASGNLTETEVNESIDEEDADYYDTKNPGDVSTYDDEDDEEPEVDEYYSAVDNPGGVSNGSTTVATKFKESPASESELDEPSSSIGSTTEATSIEQLSDSESELNKTPSSIGSTTEATSVEQLSDSESELDETSSSSWSVDSPVDFAALKADHELMHSLTDYLSRFGIKMPSDLVHRVDKTDLCSENAVGGLKYYCLKIENGQYYDPWNPWCGFIECNDGIATRRFCEPNTWMGMDSTDNLLMNKNDMCRRRLLKDLVDFRCQETTELDMCEKTKVLEAVGAPKTGFSSLRSLAAALKKPQAHETGASQSENLSKPSHVSFNVEVPSIDINFLAT